MQTSIIISACNAETYLCRTIESVLAQTVGDWELVIVDDGSTDNTAAVASAYVRRDTRLRGVQQADCGLSSARNRGLAESSSDSQYVIFLDAGDLWEQHALEALMDALAADPAAVAASGLSRYTDSQDEPCEPGELETWGRRRVGVAGRHLVGWPLDRPTTLAVLAYRNCIATAGQVLIRRSALEAAGPFDQAMVRCEDWDMWLRLGQLGHIAFVDRVVLNKRKHDRSLPSERELMNHYEFLVRQKLVSSSSLTPEQFWVAFVANWHWGRWVRSIRVAWAREMLRDGELQAAAEQFGHTVAALLRCAEGLPVASPLLWPTVKQLYRTARNTPSDIYEHLDTLRRLAQRCGHVTEFGTRGGVSTTALLAGRPQVLVSYDRQRLPAVDILERAAKRRGRTSFLFREEDVLSVEIEETDMLFIDTWHVYEQLKEELALHARKVRKYLVFHDTTTYGETGETPGHRGLWPAIEEFLREHPEWTLAARFTNNNGLTILTRTGKTASSSSAGYGVVRCHPSRGSGLGQ